MDVHQQRALGRVLKIFGEALSNAADEILKSSASATDGTPDPAEGGIAGKPLVVPRTLHQEVGAKDGDEKLNNVLIKRRTFGQPGRSQYLPSASDATDTATVKTKKGNADGRVSKSTKGQRRTRRRTE